MSKIRISLALSIATIASGFFLAACESPKPLHQQLPPQPVIPRD